MLLHDAYHLFCQVFGGKEEPGVAGYFAAGLNFAQSGLPVTRTLHTARDISHISSLYVTKKVHEISYLSNFRAVTEPSGEVSTIQALPTTPKTSVIVLKDGRIVFDGSVQQFTDSKLPAIQELAALDGQDHSTDPYFLRSMGQTSTPCRGNSLACDPNISARVLLLSLRAEFARQSSRE